MLGNFRLTGCSHRFRKRTPRPRPHFLHLRSQRFAPHHLSVNNCQSATRYTNPRAKGSETTAGPVAEGLQERGQDEESRQRYLCAVPTSHHGRFGGGNFGSDARLHQRTRTDIVADRAGNHPGTFTVHAIVLASTVRPRPANVCRRVSAIVSRRLPLKLPGHIGTKLIGALRVRADCHVILSETHPADFFF
jgi:hypothetical protein